MFTLYPKLTIYAQYGFLTLLEDEAFFKEKLKSDPNNPDLHFNLATCYSLMGNYAQALSEYKQTVFLKPDDSVALRELGNLYRMQSNKLRLAELNLKKSIAINPKDSIAWQELAFIQSDLCRSAEAIESLQASLKLNNSIENSSFSLFYIGVLQLNLRKKDEALKTAEQLEKFNSDLASQLREMAAMN